MITRGSRTRPWLSSGWTREQPYSVFQTHGSPEQRFAKMGCLYSSTTKLVSAQCKSKGVVVRLSADIRIQYRYSVGCLLQVLRYQKRRREKALRCSPFRRLCTPARRIPPGPLCKDIPLLTYDTSMISCLSHGQPAWGTVTARNSSNDKTQVMCNERLK